jgi:exonuclease V gamma subunit
LFVILTSPLKEVISNLPQDELTKEENLWLENEFPRLVRMFKDFGLLDRYDMLSRSVYVDESQFNALEYKVKKKIASMFASYYEYKNGIKEAIILGKRSGNKLASYSEEMGFKAY